jgi:hypothetical protein
VEVDPVQHLRLLVGVSGVLVQPARRTYRHLRAEEVQQTFGLVETAREVAERPAPPCRRDLCEQGVGVEGRAGRSYLCPEG